MCWPTPKGPRTAALPQRRGLRGKGGSAVAPDLRGPLNEVQQAPRSFPYDPFGAPRQEGLELSRVTLARAPGAHGLEPALQVSFELQLGLCARVAQRSKRLVGRVLSLLPALDVVDELRCAGVRPVQAPVFHAMAGLAEAARKQVLQLVEEELAIF